MTDLVERVAKGIARMVPMDSGRWNEGHGHDFPREYGDAEKRIIRAIAAKAVEIATGDDRDAR